MPKCLVIDPRFDWGNGGPPKIPWSDMVMHELHVRGFTIWHPDIPPPLRGTYNVTEAV